MMTKASKLNWHIPVPKDLQEGAICDHWTEDGEIELDCLVKVDECGFFIYWKSEIKEGDVLELSQINDVRSGKVSVNPQLANQLRQRRGENFGEVCLTVCSGLDMVNINLNHFIFPNKEVLEVWRAGLRKLTNNVKMNNVCPMTNLEKHWKRLHMTTTIDGKVSVRAIAKTFASGKTEKFVYQTIAECGLPSGKNDSIVPKEFTFEKFYKIYKTLCPRTDINGLFQEICKNTSQDEADTINTETLVNFLNDKQRDPRLNEILYPHYDSKRVMEIINTYEKNPDYISRGLISIDGLTNYLMSDENAPVFLDRLDIYQDMDNPLPHYYINSSHNTYLTGRQFGGKSSVEMYRQVLLAGCRCVELDCWDGRDPDNEPIITHGKAMCTDILFKDVIYAIRDCAFVTSEYPLILSFENHCNRHQQYKMAKYCDDIFGDLLLKEPLPDYQLEPGVPFPSPKQLKRKILIKNKRLRPEVERTELDLFWKGELAIDESEEEKEDPKTANLNAVSSGDNTTNGSSAVKPDSSLSISTTFSTTPSNSQMPLTPTTSSLPKMSKTAVVQSPSTSSTSAASSSSGIISTAPYQGSTLNVHPWLSSMVIYTQPLKFQGFDVAEEENMSSKMSSFAEPNALGYLKTQAIEFLNYNKRQLSRIYPKGARVDSSNFMPQIFWNSGCQLVSLNFQTPDLPMQLNQGKFEYNGNCGYLLKPDFMRRDDRQFDPFAETPVDGVIAAQCSVQVISGQFLSDRKVGTYVEVDMYGLPTDTIRREYKTKTVPNNGLNPMYNEEPFMFRKVVLPELAVLRFGVYEDNGRLLGQRILPFECLQAGYRHIALRTVGNFPMTLPMLFCNIELKVYIPDGLGEFINALTDPRAFLSQQEARAKAMMGMGVDESDISTEGIIGKDGSGATFKKTQAARNLALTGPKKSDEKEDAKFDPITGEGLRSEKRFLKTLKKHQKELESIRKRHLKERAVLQKTQCAAIEKIVKIKGKESDQDAVNDPTVKGLVMDQAKHWSELVEKHRKEEWALLKSQLQVQEEVLRKLMEHQQQQQLKQLEIILEKEMKEIRAAQARRSVENAKEVQMDKLKSKAEKDRRLREKHAKYTKIFIDERKAAAMKQDQRREKLKKIHDHQHLDLAKHIQHVSAKTEEKFISETQTEPTHTPQASVTVPYRFTFNRSTKSKK